MNLTLVVIGATRECLRQFSVEEMPDKLIMLANSEGMSVAALANRELGRCTTEVFGLVHADTRFGEGALRAFYEAALAGSVAGIVGVTPKKEYIWCHGDQPSWPAPVITLDYCSSFFRRDSGLKFDERFGMHCYVEDLCMTAKSKGIGVVVPKAQAGHIGASTGASEWITQYLAHRKLLIEKWPDVETT